MLPTVLRGPVEFFISYSLLYSKSMETKDPEGLGNYEPRDMVGKIYVGDHQTLLYTKYISCGPYGIEDFFLSFSNYKSFRAIDPHMHVKFSHKGLDWQD